MDANTHLSKRWNVTVSSLNVPTSVLNLANAAKDMTPVKAAFDSAGVRAIPQSHIGCTSSSIERPSLAELVDNWSATYVRRNSGPLQPEVFWTKSGGPGDRTMEIRYDLVTRSLRTSLLRSVHSWGVQHLDYAPPVIHPLG